MNRSWIPALLFMVIVIPAATANTGWWQFAHEHPELRVLLSMAPLAPDVGENVSMLFSITNDSGLITDTLSVRINITRNDQTTYLGDWHLVSNGIHQELTQFFEPGFHEVGIQIIAGNQSYVADFPVGIHPRAEQETRRERTTSGSLFFMAILSLVGGYGLGRVVKGWVGKRKSN